MENVDVKAVIVGAKRLLVVAELDEFRLAHASWRHEANVFAIGEHLDELFAHLFPVAKIFRRNIAVDDEWIRDHNALILRQRYENYSNRITKLYNLYYTICIIFKKTIQIIVFQYDINVQWYIFVLAIPCCVCTSMR